MSFEAYLGFDEATATVHLAGELDAVTAPVFTSLVEQAAERGPERLVLRMRGLTSISAEGVRALAFAHQKLDRGVDIILVGAGEDVRRAVLDAGLGSAVTIAETAG